MAATNRNKFLTHGGMFIVGVVPPPFRIRLVGFNMELLNRRKGWISPKNVT
jgi:hypothetical protein